jgi:DNA-binding LacI/PurR family transcriptional regulator
MQAAGREPMFEMRGERLYAQIRQDLLSDDRLALTRSWLVQAAADGLDAVVAYSQAEAAMLSLAAAELGLSLPDDLAIVTIADEVPPQLGRPTTTVVLPWRRIGQQAVAALAQRCEAARGTDSLETQPRDAPDAPDAPPTLIQVPPALVQGVTSHAPTG